MEVLPNDLVCQCLVRVPYHSHDNLKAVCRGWKAMVSSPKFYADRKISRTREQLICFIVRYRRVDANNSVSYIFVVKVYDPVNRAWQKLSPIDDPHFDGIPPWCQCFAVNRKLVLIGTSLMKSVYIYDFESAQWSRGADMPTPRFLCACTVSSSTGLIYVAGGYNEHQNAPLATAEAYNVEEDKWEVLPPMIQLRGPGRHGFLIEGKFVVVREVDGSAEVFDPTVGTWRRWPKDMCTINFRESCEAAATSSGDLYMFIDKHVIKKYDGEENVWSDVGTLPRHIEHVTCATQWRDCLFVSGFETNSNNNHKPISLLFNPSTGHSIEISSDDGEEIVTSAATVEI